MASGTGLGRLYGLALFGEWHLGHGCWRPWARRSPLRITAPAFMSRGPVAHPKLDVGADNGCTWRMGPRLELASRHECWAQCACRCAPVLAQGLFMCDRAIGATPRAGPGRCQI